MYSLGTSFTSVSSIEQWRRSRGIYPLQYLTRGWPMRISDKSGTEFVSGTLNSASRFFND